MIAPEAYWQVNSNTADTTKLIQLYSSRHVFKWHAAYFTNFTILSPHTNHIDYYFQTILRDGHTQPTDNSPTFDLKGDFVIQCAIHELFDFVRCFYVCSIAHITTLQTFFLCFSFYCMFYRLELLVHLPVGCLLVFVLVAFYIQQHSCLYTPDT